MTHTAAGIPSCNNWRPKISNTKTVDQPSDTSRDRDCDALYWRLLLCQRKGCTSCVSVCCSDGVTRGPLAGIGKKPTRLRYAVPAGKSDEVACAIRKKDTQNNMVNIQLFHISVAELPLFMLMWSQSMAVLVSRTRLTCPYHAYQRRRY